MTTTNAFNDKQHLIGWRDDAQKNWHCFIIFRRLQGCKKSAEECRKMLQKHEDKNMIVNNSE